MAPAGSNLELKVTLVILYFGHPCKCPSWWCQYVIDLWCVVGESSVCLFWNHGILDHHRLNILHRCCVCLTVSEAVLSVFLLALFRLKRPNQFDFNVISTKQFVYFNLSAMTSSSQLPYIVPLEMVWDCIFSACQMMEWSRRGKSWSVWKDSRLSSWVVLMKLRLFFDTYYICVFVPSSLRWEIPRIYPKHIEFEPSFLFPFLTNRTFRSYIFVVAHKGLCTFQDLKCEILYARAMKCLV